MVHPRELDKLEDDTTYKVLIEMVHAFNEGDILTGKEIKERCPFDVSPHQGIKTFFKKVK